MFSRAHCSTAAPSSSRLRVVGPACASVDAAGASRPTASTNQKNRRTFNTLELDRAFREPGSLFLRKLERAHERAFGAAVEFVTDSPMIAPNEIGRLMRIRVDEEQCALKILEEGAVRQLVEIEQQPMIQLLRLVGVTSGVEENESFTDFDVPFLVRVDLEDHHDAAKNEQEQEQKDEFVLPHKTHANFLWSSCGGGATELT